MSFSWVRRLQGFSISSCFGSQNTVCTVGQVLWDRLLKTHRHSAEPGYIHNRCGNVTMATHAWAPDAAAMTDSTYAAVPDATTMTKATYTGVPDAAIVTTATCTSVPHAAAMTKATSTSVPDATTTSKATYTRSAAAGSMNKEFPCKPHAETSRTICNPRVHLESPTLCIPGHLHHIAIYYPP